MATTLPLALLELEGDSSETFAVANPATGETLAHLPRMGADETRRAIERANAALPAWRALLAKDRARVKESGIGREGSKYGIEEWLEIKYLCMGGI
jgi:acyl-CoA reductase-like NAD-dependent aldehyde dehydrogenase